MTQPVEPDTTSLGFTLLHQSVTLDLDFAHQVVRGKSTLTIQPHTRDLKKIRINARQCKLTRLNIEGRPAPSGGVSQEDPYEEVDGFAGRGTTVHQWQMLKEKVGRFVSESEAGEKELAITIPSKVQIHELESVALQPATTGLEVDGVAETPMITSAAVSERRFAPLKLYIEFESLGGREGLHWVGCKEDEHDKRYPHVYTKPREISGVFPCVDDTGSHARCTWEIQVRVPRTLGDAFRDARSTGAQEEGGDVQNEMHDLLELSEDDRMLEMAVVCSGDIMDEIIDPEDASRKIVSCNCSTAVAAQHISFAVGPFEHVDLNEFAEVDEDEKLGQNAIRVHGFCLPGRADELRNTCMPVARAMDFFVLTYGSCPFTMYSLVFVDDLVPSTHDAASLTLSSTRLFFPATIIEPLDTNTRLIIRAVAAQWAGVYLVPRDVQDTWAIAGIQGFMRDAFMKKLAGNNEYRYQQKLASQKVCNMDVERPSLYELGRYLHLDPNEFDFLAVKSALVLFILDRRLTKTSNSSGVNRIINKIFLNAKTTNLDSPDTSSPSLGSQYLQRTCEKIGHQKLESFFQQWVYGAGAPLFQVSQTFNKKKLCVTMIISQKPRAQGQRTIKPNHFMREVKEDVSDVWAGSVQSVFSGPMTIRIHEADGTPYEHIVDIKEAITKIDIPYNTKYKRLKRRNRRQNTNAMADDDPRTDDVLLYCLGDVLQNEQDMRDWRLEDFSEADTKAMSEESWEWIRLDADFEWIATIQHSQKGYHYVSQLQQDRDVVAQYDAMARIRNDKGVCPLSVRRWFLDKLRFNDNSNNDYSDCHYIATLLTCLADSLCTTTQERKSYTFEFSNETEADDDGHEAAEAAFKRDAIDAIERYRRIDTYVSSYQNVYTTTALSCIAKLVNAGVMKSQITPVLMYTKRDNAENVRLKAFSALVDMGACGPKCMATMRWLFHQLSEDTSPSFREQMFCIFGEALGMIALGTIESTSSTLVREDELIEEAAVGERRQEQIARTASVSGALEALKRDVAENETLKEALWNAVLSPKLTLKETVALLDVCALIYQPIVSYMAICKLPAYWDPASIWTDGAGRLCIKRSATHFRTTPLPPPSSRLVELIRKHSVNSSYLGHLAATSRASALSQETQVQPQAKQSMPAPPQRQSTQGWSGPVKLSLKRKSSVASNTERAMSPKAPKTLTGASPSVASSPSVVAMSPSVHTPLASTGPPNQKKQRKTQSHIVKLRAGPRAQQVLSQTPQPSPSIVESPLLTPTSAVHSQTLPNAYAQPTHFSAPAFGNGALLQSPSPFSANGGYFEGMGTQPAFNPAMFRTYDAPATDAASAVMSPSTQQFSPTAMSPHVQIEGSANGTSSPAEVQPHRQMTKIKLKLNKEKGT
ncbi:Transcription initiation factor TFIID subunit 2 [Elasticomyces elasticus]|nr:Transcription initiation factor TFIID subunit 2 [Elasticomyces elasticus]